MCDGASGAAGTGCGSTARPVSDAGFEKGHDKGHDGIWGDADAPPPPDKDIWPTDDAPSPDRGRDLWPVDPPPPPDKGIWGDADVPNPPDQGKVKDLWPVDPPPPPDASSSIERLGGELRAQLGPELLDQWTDTCARTAWRTPDLPLSNPPHVTLRASRDGEQIAVHLESAADPISIHWEGDGRVESDGRTARWTPEAETDQLRVGIRARNGVAVAALRAKDVRS